MTMPRTSSMRSLESLPAVLTTRVRHAIRSNGLFEKACSVSDAWQASASVAVNPSSESGSVAHRAASLKRSSNASSVGSSGDRIRWRIPTTHEDHEGGEAVCRGGLEHEVECCPPNPVAACRAT